jgi:hypothetical protein
VDAEFVRYAVDEGIAAITIDRPQAANAQNPQMLKELDQAWSASDEDPHRDTERQRRKLVRRRLSIWGVQIQRYRSSGRVGRPVAVRRNQDHRVAGSLRTY